MSCCCHAGADIEASMRGRHRAVQRLCAASAYSKGQGHRFRHLTTELNPPQINLILSTGGR